MAIKGYFYASTHASAELPASLSREIGKIVVRWAYVEHKAQQVIRTLAQLTLPVSRVIAREPRLEDRITIIEQLADFHGISLNSEALKHLREGARLLAAKRHILAHGIWCKMGDVWNVVITRGQWDDDEAPSRHKSILPESMPVSASSLAIIVEGIETLDRLLDVIAINVSAKLQAPPELHPSQFPRTSPKQDRGSSEPASQPQPSPQPALRSKKLSSAQRRKMAIGRTRKAR
jgi:hypothetical protein